MRTNEEIITEMQNKKIIPTNEEIADYKNILLKKLENNDIQLATRKEITDEKNRLIPQEKQTILIDGESKFIRRIEIKKEIKEEMKRKNIQQEIIEQQKEETKYIGLEETFSTIYLTFLKNKNIYIMKINPFLNYKLFEEIISDIKYYTELRKTPKKYINKNLLQIQNEKRKQEIEKQIRQEEAEYNRMERNIMRTENRILKKIREKESLKEYNKEEKKRILQEIKEAEQLPFVEEIYLGEKLFFTFKDIYINEIVQTEIEKEINKETNEELRKPKMEMKKIRIGTLTFSASAEEGIQIINEDQLYYNGREIIHPHASDKKTCFGESKLKMLRLINEMKIKELLILVYSWATSYNKHSTYIRIQEFYNARKEKGEIQ